MGSRLRHQAKRQASRSQPSAVGLGLLGTRHPERRGSPRSGRRKSKDLLFYRRVWNVAPAPQGRSQLSPGRQPWV